MVSRQLQTALLREQRFLRGIARDLVRDTHLAEDLVQQTNSSAIERGPTNLRMMRGWMRTVARRSASRMRRREELRRVSETRAASSESDLGPGTAEIEASRAVLDALATITAQYREVLVLRYWHGRTPTSIAESLDAPLNTVKSRIARGIEAMRSELDRRTNGDRDAWVATLLALPGPRPSATASIRRALHRRAIDVAATATATALLWVAHDRPDEQVPMIKLTAASVIAAPQVSIPAIPLRPSRYAPALIRNTGAAGIAGLDVNADRNRADKANAGSDHAGSGKSFLHARPRMRLDNSSREAFEGTSPKRPPFGEGLRPAKRPASANAAIFRLPARWTARQSPRRSSLSTLRPSIFG